MFSVVFTLAPQLIFGYIKGHCTGVQPTHSAPQIGLIGGLAVAVVYGLAKAIS